MALGSDGSVGVLGAHQLDKGVHDLFHKICESALSVLDASSIEPESHLVDRSGVEVAKHEGDVRVLVWYSMEYLLKWKSCLWYIEMRINVAIQEDQLSIMKLKNEFVYTSWDQYLVDDAIHELVDEGLRYRKQYSSSQPPRDGREIMQVAACVSA